MATGKAFDGRPYAQVRWRNGCHSAILLAAAGVVWFSLCGHAEITTVSDAQDLASPSPYVVGNGTLRYTGGSATVDNAFSLSPGNGAAATIDISSENATLDVRGAFNSANGAFIKKGPGTLKLSATGVSQKLGSNVPSGKDAGSDIAWDGTTGAATTSFGAFNVAEGRLIIGGDGQTNNVMTWSDVGNRGYQKKAYLDVVGGRTVFETDMFNLCCGNGRQDNDAGSWMTISGGAYVVIPNLRILYRQWQAQATAFWGRGHLLVDGSTLQTSGDLKLGYDAGEASLVVSNRSVLSTQYNDDSAKYASLGLVMGGNYIGGSSLFSVLDHSTGMVWAVDARQGHRIHVGEGSRLEFARPVLSLLGDKMKGDAVIDGGTLGGISKLNWTAEPLPWSQWFNGMTNLYVGANGATFDVVSGGIGALSPRIVPAPGAVIGPVVKTGGGVLGIRPVADPIAVNEGTLRLASGDVYWDQNHAGTATFAASTALEIVGNRSAACMDVSSAPSIRLFPAGSEIVRGAWARNGWATVRSDGRLQLCDYGSSFGEYPFGSVFRTEKVSVDGSFFIRFDVKVKVNYSGTPLNGSFACVLHNSPDGVGAVGVKGSPTDGGYTGTVSNNSFAVIVALDGSSGSVRFAQGPVLGEAQAMSGINPYRLLDCSFAQPFACELSYDAHERQMTFRMVRSATGDSQTFTSQVDLPACVGGETAYLGFTGTGFGQWRNTVPFVNNVRFVPAAGRTLPKVWRSGGRITVAANGAKAFTVDGREDQNGFLMRSLAYGDRTRLSIARNTAAVSDASSFLGFEQYSGSGTLVKEGQGNLGLVSTNAHDVSLEVAAGGLVLRQSELETPPDIWSWDWQLNENGPQDLLPLCGTHGGICVGGTALAPFNANSRRMVDVTGSWRLSFDAYPQGYSTALATTTNVGDTFGFALHDDSSGERFVGNAGSENGSIHTVRNAVGGILGVYNWGGKNKTFCALTGSGAKTQLNNFTAEQVMSGDKIHVEMTYDADESKLRYIVQHAANAPVTNEQTGVDLATRIPSGRARLCFGAAPSGNIRMLTEFANVKFEKMSGAVPYPAGVSYLASLAATTANLPIRCELETNATIRLAETVALPSGGRLSVTAPYAPAAVSMGVLSATDGAPALTLGTNVTALVESAASSSTLTVEGGTLTLAAGTALAEGGTLVLTDNANLCLAFPGTMKVKKVLRNGEALSGLLAAGTQAWVSGTGRIVCGAGVTIILR